jgi:flagellar biogenesis protein FliO
LFQKESRMTDTVAPEPTPEQAALFARVRRMMMIAGLTSALAVVVVLIAVGYRLYRGEGSASAASTDVTATLPKGARIVSTGVAGDRLVVTLDIGGTTEIRTFDAKTLKPAGRLKFVSEP